MSDVVIRTEGLGKRYRIGQREAYRSLRQVLTNALGAPLRMFRRTPPSHFWALKDVCLEVREGEVLGLIGRNGAGKTTLLKILSRITRPTAGTAEVRGRIGSLLEVGTGFHPELTGRENIYLSGAILGMGKREIDRKFDSIAAFAEIDQFIDTPVKHYSSGMYVRLAFAVAAHLEPEILLVDEVLAVGDIKFQKKCLGKMGDVARAGRTVLFVSHQLNQIRRLCERVIWFDAGEVRRSGPTAEVVSAYESAMSSAERPPAERENGHPFRARFTGWEIVEPRGDSAHSLASLGPVRVRFSLDVREPIRRGHQGIALFNADRQLMWARSTNDLCFDPGVQEILYSFPSLPLRPGPYFWTLSLWDDGGLVDMWESVPEFVIATENMQHSMDEWNGILNLPSEVSVHAQNESRHANTIGI